MQQLIKITSVPIQTMSYTQNARLISSNSVDIERRKALARQMSFHRRASRGGSSLPVEDIAKINRAFSRRTVTAPEGRTVSRQQATFQQAQSSVPKTANSPSVSSVSQTAAPQIASVNISSPVEGKTAYTEVNLDSSYATELGALEMRVAKGDLTFLPPMIMTIVTQYPELHFEYLGDFNYVPPREAEYGGNINLFT